MAANENKLSINNDCLSMIFQNLSIIERIKIERVCKHWNEVSKSSWGDIKKLNLNPRSWGFMRSEFIAINKIKKKISRFEIIELLKRCGKYLEDLDLTSDLLPHEQLWFTIGIYCTNVKSLVVKGYLDDVTSLIKNFNNLVNLELEIFIRSILRFKGKQLIICHDDELSLIFKNLHTLKLTNAPKITESCFLNLSLLEHFELYNYYITSISEKENFINALKTMKNLKIFKAVLDKNMSSKVNFIVNDLVVALQNCSNLAELDLTSECKHKYSTEEENQFGILFKNNQNLESLSLQKFDLTGECLIYLNDNILKELTLNYCRNLNFIYLRKLNQLTKFTYLCDNGISADDVIKFSSSLVFLKYLKIDFSEELLVTKKFFPILVLDNLEELNLPRYFRITDNFLKMIAVNLRNLKKFYFQDEQNVTDIGLYAITGLPKLEYLNLNFMYKITDAGFNTMKNLKKLKLYCCSNITNDGLKKILTESEKLDYLFITDCYKVDGVDLLLFANEITKKRENNIVLHVHENILDWYYDSLKNIKKSPLLEFTDHEYENE